MAYQKNVYTLFKKCDIFNKNHAFIDLVDSGNETMLFLVS